jgi:DNA polymerase
MAFEREDSSPVRAYLEFFRDLGIYDFYRDGPPAPVIQADALRARAQESSRRPDAPATIETPFVPVAASAKTLPVPASRSTPAPASVPQFPEIEIPKPVPFNDLAPLPTASMRVLPPARAAALEAIRKEIGDCTRCPLAYGGRHTIVFGDGDPQARLMFIGEGPGAEEDEQGLPFVGKSGQLLNNMIAAMGLKREQVYIANIVKCRPPANRAPEPAEANTCTQFLVRQMDVVQPEFVVALGATAAMYLLGVRQSLASLRGRWHDVRGAKTIVTYHPAFLLRDPRQKGEAWKDLQMVMAAMKLGRQG